MLRLYEEGLGMDNPDPADKWRKFKLNHRDNALISHGSKLPLVGYTNNRGKYVWDEANRYNEGDEIYFVHPMTSYREFYEQFG